MSYLPITIAHMTFDSTPLMEMVSTRFASHFGISPKLVDGVFGHALQMDNETRINFGLFTFPAASFSIGFWLNSVNPGMAQGELGETISLKMPVISRAIFPSQMIHGLSGFHSPPGFNIIFTFIILEETKLNKQNVLKIMIRGNSPSSQATLSSSPYNTGVFNHFWITYNGSARIMELFINTNKDNASLSGSVPPSIFNSALPVFINDSAPGSLPEVAKNSGQLDDLVIFNTAIGSIETIKRIANKGAIYVADSVLSDINEVDQVAIFDDLGTLQINSAHAANGKLYVAKNDGTIMKGHNLTWQSRREFENTEELKALNLSGNSNDSNVEISSGVLRVQNATIRV